MTFKWWLIQDSSVQSLVVSDSLQPHGLQHSRPPCPSPTPGVYPNSCPLSWLRHATISSSVVPFSSCPQSLPASGAFQMSRLFFSGGQSLRVLASTSVLPMNIQHWFPLGWTGWISLQSKFRPIWTIKWMFFIKILGQYEMPNIPSGNKRRMMFDIGLVWRATLHTGNIHLMSNSYPSSTTVEYKSCKKGRMDTGKHSAIFVTIQNQWYMPSKRVAIREFPSSPVVRILCSNCWSLVGELKSHKLCSQKTNQIKLKVKKKKK